MIGRLLLWQLNSMRKSQLRFDGGVEMKYMVLNKYEKQHHPSIHYTGSVSGMKKLGYWGKNDKCVRCGQYIYNLSIKIK